MKNTLFSLKFQKTKSNFFLKKFHHFKNTKNMFCIRAYDQILKVFHAYFFKNKIAFYHSKWISYPIYNYQLGFDQNTKNHTTINLFH